MPKIDSKRLWCLEADRGGQQLATELKNCVYCLLARQTVIGFIRVANIDQLNPEGLIK